MGKIFNCLSLKERRRYLRKNQTKSEKILWEKLRRGQIGFRFLRQFGIGFYIADFYCPSQKLVIEVDGVHHLRTETRKYDAERTRIINECGISVVRFTNHQILNDIEFVLCEIKKKAIERKSELPLGRLNVLVPLFEKEGE